MSGEVLPCFNKDLRDFLLTVTIHKARNLSRGLNANTFVVAEFNGETNRTKTFPNSDCPFFNEYFVFESRVCLEDLLKKNLRLAVIRETGFLKKNEIIGELNVNLSSVWRQNHHAFVMKWGVLEKIGDDNKNATAGYLQLDLTIVTPNESPTPIVLQSFNDDIIEENLMLPDDSSCDPENVKYLVNIFDGSFAVKRDYILQVSFGSLHTRTRQIKHTKFCRWNEQLIFQGKFPSLTQVLVFELLVQDFQQWKVKCSVDVNFSEMCWRVDGTYNKPSFGPTFIYFYEGIHKNLFYGKLLISIDTEEIEEKFASTLQHKQDILKPLNESQYWDEEIFKVNLILVNMDALNVQQDRLKIYLSCENNFSNTFESDMKPYDEKLKLKFVKFDSNVRPILSLTIKLPDNRLKFQVQNLVRMLIHEMETNIRNFKLFEARYHDNVEYQSKCLKMFFADLKEMIGGIGSKLFYKTFKQVSGWDANFLKFVQFTIDQIGAIVEENFDLVSYVNIRELLLETLNDTDRPPDVFLNVTSEGKLVALHRFKMMKYFHSQAFDARGERSGRIHTVIVKPSTCIHTCINCGCFFGKFDVFMWIGSEKEVSEWLPQNTVAMSPTKINFTVDRFFKCNVFVHQAKIQPGVELNGLCNPKLVVTSNGMQERTKVATQSLSAVWNEVLVIENINLFDIGDVQPSNYPAIILFLFDEDKRKLDLIGIGLLKVPIKPTDKAPAASNLIANLLSEKFDFRKLLHQFVHHFPPHLRWINFHKDGASTAEVLMSAELLQLPAPNLTVKEVDKNDSIPMEILPDMRKFRMEVTFAGVREASKKSHFASGRFKIELTMGELKLSSGFSAKAFKTNSNFLDPFASGYLLLPDQFEFWPPIIIKHLDCSHKVPSVLGAALIRRPEKFFVKDKPKEMQRFLGKRNTSDDVEGQQPVDVFEIEESEPLLGSSRTTKVKRALSHYKWPKFLQFSGDADVASPLSLEREFTWWTKFYNSNRDPGMMNNSVHHLKIYRSELEKESRFENLNDWAFPVDLVRGKGDSTRSEKYGKLKCSIRISKCAGKEYFESGKQEKFAVNLPRFNRNLMLEVPIVVRAYIVEALNLRSRDVHGNSDAFIKLEFGGQVISDRAHYVPNQFSPVFGKRFQLSGVIPRNTFLKISIYDRDTLSASDLIGSTSIDLEDRVRTKYLAGCGLPKEFNSSGYNAWRNALLPSELLSKVCIGLELSPPQYFPDRVELAGIEFKDRSKISQDGNLKERLALAVLNDFDEISGVGFEMVPEHVETRSLYRQDRPGIEQGKLLMWVEIFDPSKTVPQSIDITPIPPRPYELRVIVWNAKDVILNDKNVFGKQMSDIYVKGWLHNRDEVQCTDIHFRSMNGEGNFNWRMIWDFKYSTGEDMMVITRKKNVLEKFDSEVKVPAVLNVQVWDNDSFSPDDFLGTLSINLSHFPRPYESPARCSMKQMSKVHDNLFAGDRSVRGWFPVYGKCDGESEIKQTGKLELELEVLLKDKARADPAGIGHDGPKKLPPPNRPDTSFNWFRNPAKSAKYILCPKAAKCTVVIVMLLILALIVSSVITDLPKKIFSKAVDPDKTCAATS